MCNKSLKKPAEKNFKLLKFNEIENITYPKWYTLIYVYVLSPHICVFYTHISSACRSQKSVLNILKPSCWWLWATKWVLEVNLDLYRINILVPKTVVLRGKALVWLSAYLKKSKRSQINNLVKYLKTLRIKTKQTKTYIWVSNQKRGQKLTK